MANPTDLIPEEDDFGGLSSNYNRKGEAFDIAPAQGVDSIFNKFNIFRYHKYGMGLKDGQYNNKDHFDKPGSSNAFSSWKANESSSILNDSSDKIAQGITSSLFGSNSSNDAQGAIAEGKQLLKNEHAKRVIQNPTASTIIEWSRSQTVEGSPYGPPPYSWSDFIYCKNYGKIPNNALVTLRRFPTPIMDNMKAANDYPMVPIAQAVTWFGEESENPLSSILKIEWDIKWKQIFSRMQDVDGNEIRLDDVIALASFVPGLESEGIKKALRTSLALAFGEANQETLHQLAGFDEKIYNYQKSLYSDDGPFWNRVHGPVNVVRGQTMRDIGLGEKSNFTQTIKVKFHYKLRSFSNVNPKIAMLDLISNFLSLTYNTAPFWGGGIRYFPKPGVPFRVPGSNKMLQGDYKGAVAEFIAFIQAALKDKASAGAAMLFDKNGQLRDDVGDDLYNAVAANIFGKLQQEPLLMRSFLDGSPVGEWHLTIGNPMNPIAAIGNLIVDSAEMQFDESLGLDDFPTGVTFTVNLKHGKPRDKSAIESIFNMGNGPLSMTQLPRPSSAYNTFGDYNAASRNNAGQVTGQDGQTDEPISQGDQTAQLEEVRSEAARDARIRATGRINNDYGEFYGTDNPNLEWYFQEFATKD